MFCSRKRKMERRAHWCFGEIQLPVHKKVEEQRLRTRIGPCALIQRTNESFEDNNVHMLSENVQTYTHRGGRLRHNLSNHSGPIHEMTHFMGEQGLRTPTCRIQYWSIPNLPCLLKASWIKKITQPSGNFSIIKTDD